VREEGLSKAIFEVLCERRREAKNKQIAKGEEFEVSMPSLNGLASLSC
jgi:hypothetical protein